MGSDLYLRQIGSEPFDQTLLTRISRKSSLEPPHPPGPPPREGSFSPRLPWLITWYHPPQSKLVTAWPDLPILTSLSTYVAHMDRTPLPFKPSKRVSGGWPRRGNLRAAPGSRANRFVSWHLDSPWVVRGTYCFLLADCHGYGGITNRYTVHSFLTRSRSDPVNLECSVRSRETSFPHYILGS